MHQDSHASRFYDIADPSVWPIVVQFAGYRSHDVRRAASAWQTSALHDNQHWLRRDRARL